MSKNENTVGDYIVTPAEVVALRIEQATNLIRYAMEAVYYADDAANELAADTLSVVGEVQDVIEALAAVEEQLLAAITKLVSVSEVGTDDQPTASNDGVRSN